MVASSAVGAIALVSACRLLAADIPCATDDHCPPLYQCGPAAVCLGADDVEPDGGTPVVDGGPVDPDGGVDAGQSDDAGVDAGPDGPVSWWDARYGVAVALDVTGGPVAVDEAPIVFDAPLQALIGARGTLDADSPRVVEEGATGAAEIPSWFSGSDGDGLMAFLLPGELPAGATRRLWLYLALAEDGGVGQPVYWLNEARDPVNGPGAALHELDAMPLCARRLTAPGVAVILNSCWRVFSTGVDHYAAPTTLASNWFLVQQQETVRLDQSGLTVIESLASAGPARLRLLTLLTSERGILSALRVEELLADAPLEIYAYADIDVPEGDAGGDIGRIEVAVHAAIIEDGATGRPVALVHDGQAALETVGSIGTVGDEIFNRSLSGLDELTTADAAAAMRWAFAAVTTPVLVKDATVLVADTNEVERVGRRFFSPIATLGAVVERP